MLNESMTLLIFYEISSNKIEYRLLLTIYLIFFKGKIRSLNIIDNEI